MIEKIIKLLEEKNYIVEDVTIYFRDEKNKEKYIQYKTSVKVRILLQALPFPRQLPKFSPAHSPVTRL